MPRIAEDLFLLLVNDPSGVPAAEPGRVDRMLAAALLLDLAHARLLRPAAPGDPARGGTLVALRGHAPNDPVLASAYAWTCRAPRTPGRAVRVLARGATRGVAAGLASRGAMRSERIGGRLRPRRRWRALDRGRADAVRAALIGTLFEGRPADPVTAALVTVLHAADGFGAVLVLNDRGWRWVHARATEIAAGGWLSEGPTGPAEANLAATARAVVPALGAGSASG